MSDMDTIAAIATPRGRGGVAILRVSGPEAFAISERIFTGSSRQPEDRKLYLGKIQGEGICDECLAVRFSGPHSYTGEDVVEFQIHGGQTLAEELLLEIIRQGARLAVNGEFTKRAFLNGRISLSGAEGAIEMIEAESRAELAAGYRLMRGELNQVAVEIQKRLTDLIARAEVLLDDPEGDASELRWSEEMDNICRELNKLDRGGRTGKRIKNGITVAIAGKPNAGKSSLMNRLLRYDRAIVTEEAGTTRDTLESAFTLNGVKINLVDTAGIRQAVGKAEQLGVERAREAVREADLVLYVADATQPRAEPDAELDRLLEGKRCLLICNKSDLTGFDPGGSGLTKRYETVAVSAKDGNGIEELKDRIYAIISEEELSDDSLSLTNERHANAVHRAAQAAERALKTGLRPDATLDVLALNLSQVWSILGEITGNTANEEIINHIFSKFCVGK